jgi:hypothetical protein
MSRSILIEFLQSVPIAIAVDQIRLRRALERQCTAWGFSMGRPMDGIQDTSVSLFQVAGSVLASFFGVQSSKNRERDFRSGRFGVFVAVGAAMTFLLIVSIYLIVALVLS